MWVSDQNVRKRLRDANVRARILAATTPLTQRRRISHFDLIFLNTTRDKSGILVARLNNLNVLYWYTFF